jgi:uncharacterized protein (DUF1778 family)
LLGDKSALYQGITFSRAAEIFVTTTALRFCYAGFNWSDAWLSPMHQEENQMAIAVANRASRRTVKRAKDTREPLNMRVLPETRSLIDRAAELAGKNRTDFVLDAARQAAQNVLLDRAVISLNHKAHAAFVALLDAPPQPNERLRKSLETPAPWEK